MNLFALLATIGLDTADFERGIDQSERRGKGFGATMAGVGASIAKACAAIGTAVLGMGTMAVKAGMEFGGSMDTIQARTGMTSDEIGTLNRTFRDMALEGRHSAKDIASAMAKVAVAGQDVNTATDLMRYSMVLADAVGKDLGSTAYFLGNYFLKVGKDMSYAEQYINMFAGAVQATGISLDTLQNYLFRSNVTLQTTNISGTEATAMFGLLYQAGIRGAYAYSGIEAATRSLLNPTEDMVYWLNRLGVERYEENGQLRDGLPFLKDVASAIDTLSGSYRSKAFDVLGATISGTAFLGGMIDIQDTLPDLVKELYEAGQVTDGMGIAFEMAEIQAGGLGQMFGKFRANINELKITFFDLIEVPLYEHLGNIAQVFSALVERISYGGDLHESMQAPADAFINLAGKVLDLVVAIIPIVIEWLPKLVNLLILLLDNAVPLLCVIGALYVLFKGYKALEYVGGFIKGLTAAKEGLTIAANASTAATRAGKRAFELYSRGVAALTKVKGYLAYAFKAVIKVLTGPAGIVIVIIAVIAFLVRLFKTNEEFREKVIKIWEAVRDFFKAVWEAIKAIFSAVIDFIRDLFTNWLEHTRRQWEIAWDTIKSVLQAAWDMIVGVIESVINIIQGIISTFISVLTGDWQGAMDGLVDIGRNFLNLIGNVFGGITEIGRNLVGGLWEGISSRMGWIADNVRSFGSNIMGSIRSVFGISSPSKRFAEIGRFIGDGLANGLESLTNSAKIVKNYGSNILQNLNQISKQKLTQLAGIYEKKHTKARKQAINQLQKLRNESKNLLSSMFNELQSLTHSQSHPVGQNMVQGIINGVNSMQGALFSTMQSMAQNALNAAKSTLQISSPSRAFMELGEYSMEGFAIGFEDLIKEVKKIWDEVSLELSPINNQAAFSGVSAGNTGSSAPGIEINNNWYVEGQPTDIDIEQVRQINRYQMQELQDALRSAGYGGVS